MTRLTPRSPVVKKLLALSGNECAYRDCHVVLVHDGIFVGDLAHIYAAEEGGPRYHNPDNPGMTDEQRRGFDNLFFLCLTHHRLVDNKQLEHKYPAELLLGMKSEHESKLKKPYEASEGVLRQVETQISIEATQNNSLVNGVQYNSLSIVNISSNNDEASVALNKMTEIIKKDEAVGVGDNTESEEDGILDKIADAEIALPIWSQVLTDLGEEIKGIGPIMNKGVAELEKSDKMSRGLSGRREVIKKTAHTLDKLAIRIEELGDAYEDEFSKVDKGIGAILELANMQPEKYSDFKEFLNTILGLVDSANEGIGSVSGMLDSMKQLEVLSKDMKRTLGKVRTGLQPAVDSLPKMNVWGGRIKNLQNDAI